MLCMWKFFILIYHHLIDNLLVVWSVFYGAGSLCSNLDLNYSVYCKWWCKSYPYKICQTINNIMINKRISQNLSPMMTGDIQNDLQSVVKCYKEWLNVKASKTKLLLINYSEKALYLSSEWLTLTSNKLTHSAISG